MFRRRRAPARDDTLFNWGGGDRLTLHDAFAGVLLLGAPGSGKTSAGLGQLMAGIYAHPQEPSAFICPAKGGDLEQHLRWHKASRSRLPFFVFGEQTAQAFNWLGHAVAGRGGVGAAVPMLEAVQRLLTRGQALGGDAFFLPQGTMQLAEATRACWLGNKRVCVRDVHAFLASAPATDADLDDDTRFATQTLKRLAAVPGAEADRCLDYWTVEWPSTCRSEKTAAAIQATALQPVRQMLSGPVGETMGGPETTFAPEDLESGCVLYLDFPVLQGFEPYKLALATWTMAVNRYALSRPEGGRPIVVISDEYPQTALEGEDARIAATGRSARLAGVRIAQNLPQLAASLGGGDKGRQEAMALLGCMGHVVAFANACKETNEHFAGLAGHEMQTTYGGSSDGNEPFDAVGYMLGTWTPRATASFSQQMLPVLKPQEFLGLRTGGPGNKFLCDAVVFAANRTFADGRSIKRVTLRQVL
ncbi:MAG: hypothetical protein C0501_21300 [Isosphaera sp.]|nr:hypothetical protein [Isosphaera sp.]